MQSAIINTNVFNEDRGTYMGANAQRALYGFKPQTSSGLEKAYWEVAVSLKAGDPIGFLSYADPYGYIDGGAAPGSAHQICCTTQPWKGEVLCWVLMPELRTVWDDRVLLQYIDRWVNHGIWAAPDPCAPAEATMDNYGITFGPDPGNPGDCIRDNDSSNGIGRYPELHGLQTDDGNRRSEFQAAMWDAYRSNVELEPPEAIRFRPNANFKVNEWLFRRGELQIYDCRGRLVAKVLPEEDKMNFSFPSIINKNLHLPSGTYIIHSGVGGAAPWKYNHIAR
jgi:hypothetical protein